MSHVVHQLYYHFTWATYSREPLIDRAWRPHFLNVLNEEVKTRGGWPIRHNAMPDHIHLLCRLPPTIVLTDFIGQVKAQVHSESTRRFDLDSSCVGRRAMAY